MKRKIYLLLGAFAMCTYGLMYNWTVFSAYVQASVNCTVASASMVFSFSQICFCTGGVISGFMYKKLPFNLSMIIASMMISLGLTLTSLSYDVKTMYLTYSLIFNLGAGFAYKSLLTAIIGWYPEKAGFASGILLMGTGLTAFMFNLPTTYAIQAMGWRPAMRLVAVIAGSVSLLASTIIRQNRLNNSKAEPADTAEDVNTKAMIHSNKFYIYFAWSILLLAGCTSISGNAVFIAKSVGISVSVAAVLSMAISLCNSLSRVVYGVIYDKKGRKMAMTISTALFVMAVLSLFGVFISRQVLFIYLSYIFIGLSFGGVPSISSTYILKTFGKKYYPSNFSIQGTYSLFSSLLGTTLFGIIYAGTNTMSLAFSYLLVYALLAVILLKVINHLFMKQKSVAE
ncbi:MAG: MFS transporter [Erysipelotrichaceae bacterium]|nr:MFS transporter [Erysipelotrichaceae bacterium]